MAAAAPFAGTDSSSIGSDLPPAKIDYELLQELRPPLSYRTMSVAFAMIGLAAIVAILLVSIRYEGASGTVIARLTPGYGIDISPDGSEISLLAVPSGSIMANPDRGPSLGPVREIGPLAPGSILTVGEGGTFVVPPPPGQGTVFGMANELAGWQAASTPAPRIVPFDELIKESTGLFLIDNSAITWSSFNARMLASALEPDQDRPLWYGDFVFTIQADYPSNSVDQGTLVMNLDSFTPAGWRALGFGSTPDTEASVSCNVSISELDGALLNEATTWSTFASLAGPTLTLRLVFDGDHSDVEGQILVSAHITVFARLVTDAAV